VFRRRCCQIAAGLLLSWLIVEGELITDIAVCILVAWLLGLVAQVLRQPLVLAYLVGGYAVGPMGLRWIAHEESIQTIGEMGLILLLFMIGLEIDLRKILRAGRLITVTALVQILGCGLLGFAFFRWVGAPLVSGSLETLYLAATCALSSTVIIVKILYDKRELDTLPGRISLGVLVLQDLFAILFLALQPGLLHPEPLLLLGSLGKVVLLTASAFVVSRYVLPPLFRSVALLPELVQVGALAWCFLTAGWASWLGLSREMGALIAGVAISTFPYQLDVSAKVTSLRDFFVTLFFVSLGMTVPAPDGRLIGGAVLVACFVAASRLATAFPALYLMRQGHRTSSLVSLHLSQLSEFSLVILALGVQSAHVGGHLSGVVAYAFVILAVSSSYSIKYAEHVLRGFQALLHHLRLPDLGQDASAEAAEAKPPRLFLLGFYKPASSLLEELGRAAPEWLPRLAVIDFNPVVYARLRARGIRVIYGDIGQRETLIHAGVSQAELVVVTLSDIVLKGTSNVRLVRQIREINPRARIVAQTDSLVELPALYAAGADYVMAPRFLEARELCEAILAADRQLLVDKRKAQESDALSRQEILP